MAGSDQRKQSSRKKDRLGPSIAQGSSRVSKVVGSVGSQSVRVEQRSSSPATRQRSRGQATSKRAQGGKQGTKKGSPHANRRCRRAAPSRTRSNRCSAGACEPPAVPLLPGRGGCPRLRTLNGSGLRSHGPSDRKVSWAPGLEGTASGGLIGGRGPPFWRPRGRKPRSVQLNDD